MTTFNPKISVLMSVYNGADYLQEAIDSILGQTYQDFEFVIINDCSTDKTWEILQRNAAQDSRIILVDNNENLGLIRSLNKGLDISRGDFIARQDADDISVRDRFEKEIAVIDNQPDCVLVSGNIQVIEGNDKTIVEIIRRDCLPFLINWYLLFSNRLAGHSQVMYRRDVVVSLGGYSKDHLYMEDYELWCRLARTGKRLVILPDILLTYRRHGQSVSAQKREQQETNDYLQAQDNLQRLLNEKISIDTVKAIVGFWKGKRLRFMAQTHHKFPSGDDAKLVHEMTIKIRNAFVQHYQGDQDAHKVLETLNALIAQQFVYWLRSPLTSRHSIWSKVQISFYALRWSPLDMPLAWLMWLIRSPIDFGVTLMRKVGWFDRFNASLNTVIK